MSQNVNVNLVPGNYPKEFHVSQYDVGRQLVANIVDSTGAYSIPSGATVTLVGTKPSGFGFTLSGSVGSGGVVTFSTTATVTAEYGRIPCEIRIESGNTVLGTANCMLIVEMSPHPEGTTDGDGEVIVNQITLLLEQITQQADRAEDAKDDAKASELAAEGYAVGKQNGTEVGPESPYYHNNCKWYGAQFDEALKDYAKINGYYKDMTVGTAKQLLSDSTTTDTEPYIYRQTAGGGDREEVEEVVGGTVAWNQLTRIRYGRDSYTELGVTATNNSGIFELSGTLTTYRYISVLDALQIIEGHKYLLDSKIISNPNNLSFKYAMLNANPKVNIGTSSIVIAESTKATGFGFDSMTIGADYTGIKLYLNLFDLTAMFGTTIADYIYSLEQSQAGAGVAWFKALFPKAYYPYNAGELMSVKTSAHATTGFNQWDEEWEVGGYWSDGSNKDSYNGIRAKNHIRVLPNTDYYCSSSIRYIHMYDSEGARLTYREDVTTFNTPNNCAYITFCTNANYGTTYNHDICINLSDQTRNGEYEPYTKHTYPLDSTLTLRGIPKLDNGNLYYDGDEYESDGTVTRKYGIVDLGTLNWNKESEGVFYATATSLGMNAITNTVLKTNLVCSNYVAESINSIQQNKTGVGAYHYSGNNNDYLYVGNSAFDTAANAKTALNGVYLVYELATPTTETADPYTAIQVCDPNGTEEWTDERTVQIPVGNVTKYHANLKEKLEDLPAIPSAPSANGTYTLKATVSGGAVTYQWVNG